MCQKAFTAHEMGLCGPLGDGENTIHRLNPTADSRGCHSESTKAWAEAHIAHLSSQMAVVGQSMQQVEMQLMTQQKQHEDLMKLLVNCMAQDRHLAQLAELPDLFGEADAFPLGNQPIALGLWKSDVSWGFLPLDCGGPLAPDAELQ